MADVIFQSISQYVSTCSELDTLITTLKSYRITLMTTYLSSIESGHLDEYWYDDGHIKIRMKYRNANDVMNAGVALERMIQMYANQKQGRMTRLMDARNFL